MRYLIVFCTLLIAALLTAPAQAQAVTYGGNLLGDDPNGPSGFGDLTPWSLTEGCSQSDEIYLSPPYSLMMDNSGAGYWKMATIVLADDILPNRHYRWQCSLRHSGSAPVSSNRGFFNGVQIFNEETPSNQSWKTISGAQWLAAGQDSITFRIQSPTGDASYVGRFAHWDNISIQREAVKPQPQADSRHGVLSTGRANEVRLYVASYPLSRYDGARHLFDPDLQVSATNAAVESVAVIDDETAAVTITPSADGPVELTLTNVYSQQNAVYAMTAATPVNCGDPGTFYLDADMPGARDCYVDLGDFAILAQQWLQCTDADNPACDFTW